MGTLLTPEEFKEAFDKVFPDYPKSISSNPSRFVLSKEALEIIKKLDEENLADNKILSGPPQNNQSSF